MNFLLYFLSKNLIKCAKNFVCLNLNNTMLLITMIKIFDFYSKILNKYECISLKHVTKLLINNKKMRRLEELFFSAFPRLFHSKTDVILLYYSQNLEARSLVNFSRYNAKHVSMSPNYVREHV